MGRPGWSVPALMSSRFPAGPRGRVAHGTLSGRETHLSQEGLSPVPGVPTFPRLRIEMMQLPPAVAEGVGGVAGVALSLGTPQAQRNC